MSADKYAQFIAEQQRKLSVSGVNAVDLQEKKQMSKADIAKLREPKDDIDADDLEALRNKEHLKKEEVEQIDEVGNTSAGKKALGSYIGKAAPEVLGHAYAAGMTNTNDPKTKEKSFKKAFKRVRGIERATKRLAREEVEELDELKGYQGNKGQKLLGKVQKRAVNRLMKAADDGDVKNAKKNQRVANQAYDRFNEEAEQVDEIRAIKGVHATRMQKAPSITPSKVRYKGRGSKPKVQTDLNITASYEISADESAYLEEMVGKGKLNDILMHHKDNMRHHEKMLNHHMVQADKAEEVGDERGFDHHTGEAIHHEMQAQHHQIRFDHASGLKARANAQREMKAAQSAMKSASEKIAAAKQDKRDWG
jgi:hypothetical protein